MLSLSGEIDLYYGDETHFCSEGYVPRGWQFKDEKVAVFVERRYKINCFGIINRQNDCLWKTTTTNINSNFVIEFLDKLSLNIKKDTVIVLDNARLHKSKAVKERIKYWEQRGLFLFFLTTYSPELNIIETLWRTLKTTYIRPQDYSTEDNLHYQLNRLMSSIGQEWNIKFSDFNLN